MILADTSKWVDHLRKNDPTFAALLDEELIVAHPLVTGEIAMGSLSNRATLLDDLLALPQIAMASNEDVLHFVESRRLFSLGIGFIDAHLLFSVMSKPGTRFWTRDRRLLEIAQSMGLDYRVT